MASLVRSDAEAEEGKGIARALRALSDGARARSGAGAAHAGAAADGRRHRRWATSIRRDLAQRHPRSCSRAHRFDLDLRALLVGGAVRGGRARHAEDPRLRRHGFAEMARIRALQAVPAVAGLRLEGREAASARSGGWRARFDLCTATTRAEWETLRRLRHRRADRLVPERRRQRLFRSRRRAVRPGHDPLRRPDGLLPESGMHVRLLRAARCRCCRRTRPGDEARDRRRRSVARGAAARRELPGVDGHRIGAGRAALPAPLAR